MARTYRRRSHRPGERCSTTGKTSFKSTKAARDFASLKRNDAASMPVSIRCEWCDWFHLTSREHTLGPRSMCLRCLRIRTAKR